MFFVYYAHSSKFINSEFILDYLSKKKKLPIALKLPVYMKRYVLKSHFLKDKRNLLRIFYILRAQNEAVV